MSATSTDLSPAQLYAIESTERAMSALSVTASLFVIISFLKSNLFQTPVNRLIFYATWGNIMANVATLVGRSGLEQGEGTALCRFQAVFIQCNAYRYNPSELKKLELRIYGRANMWCWIKPEWNAFRMGFFYGPVWFMIIVTMSILIYAGKEVISNQQQIRKISANNLKEPNKFPLGMVPNYTLQQDSRSTEPQTLSTLSNDAKDAATNGFSSSNKTEREVSPRDTLSFDGRVTQPNLDSPSRSVTFDMSAVNDIPNRGPSRSNSNAQLQPYSRRLSAPATLTPTTPVTPASRRLAPVAIQQPMPSPNDTAYIEDTASPTNEEDIADAQRPYESDIEAVPTSTCASTSLEPMRSSSQNQSQSQSQSSTKSFLHRQSSIERHNATYMYTKRVSLFFISLLVTWAPSTMNRIYLIVHPERPSFGLSYAASLVLPLQGFWNFVVYTGTSIDAIRALYAMYKTRWGMQSDESLEQQDNGNVERVSQQPMF
ncbi:hypothetical protein FQN51_005515 [Onygenales sp. PD_10]|nr:hypothetical protein FQN51_005515 [Onygenales sp. PD_10]